MMTFMEQIEETEPPRERRQWTRRDYERKMNVPMFKDVSAPMGFANDLSTYNLRRLKDRADGLREDIAELVEGINDNPDYLMVHAAHSAAAALYGVLTLLHSKAEERDNANYDEIPFE